MNPPQMPWAMSATDPTSINSFNPATSFPKPVEAMPATMGWPTQQPATGNPFMVRYNTLIFCMGCNGHSVHFYKFVNNFCT